MPADGISPEMLQRMMQMHSQQPNAGQQGGTQSPPQQSLAAAAPMGLPQEKSGSIAAAQVNVHIALTMLEQALPMFGSDSDEGRKLLKILPTLTDMTSKSDTSDLVPAEVLQMVQQLPQMGGGTDVQKALMQQLQQPQQQPQMGG